MDPLTIQLFRIDPLTGCNNFLSFVEKLNQLTESAPAAPFSLVVVDLNHLKMMNKTRGYPYGDSVIRWIELVLREECKATTYRIGGDEFTAILTEGSVEDHRSILDNIFARLEKEAPPLGIPAPAASIALIQFVDEGSHSPLGVLTKMDKAILDIKKNRNRGSRTYSEKELTLITPSVDHLEKEYAHIDWVAQRLIHSFLSMGRLLDDAQQVAYIDSTSGLPNFRAAMHKIEQTLFSAKAANTPFVIVLMDGDNLRLYNEISYAAGDEMIRRMSVLLSSKLRPGDFLARWRTGDEFIAILPDTREQGALIVGERFRTTIKEAAQTWEFPITISGGIAVYPNQGNDAATLIDSAETALHTAKKQGKDCVVVAQK